jgi:hypothetical protein
MTPTDDPSSYLTCSRCKSRVELLGADAGVKVKCPNCGLELIVSSQSQSDAGAGEGRGEDDEYALRVEPDRPPPPLPYVPGRDYSSPRIREPRAVEEEEHPKSPWQTVRGTPPSGLFFAGTFGFPLLPMTRSHTLALAGGALAALAALRIGLYCMSTGEGAPAASASAVAAGVLFIAIGLAIVALWVVAASVYGLTVLREASSDCDSIEAWPIAYSLDAAKQSRYVLSALAVGVLPGLVTAPLWDWLGWPKSLPMSTAAAMLFPLALLSMLETNSPLTPVWPPLWESVLRASRAWGLFYLITVPAAAAVSFLLVASWKWGAIAHTLLTAALLPAAWLIYFRLLGRLAGFCSGDPAEKQVSGQSSVE